MTVIATIAQLEAIYGETNEASTVKVADRITPSYRVLIEKSPFAALATSGREGLDCSPRGDLPGFVRIHDDKTLMMPDRRGNNRVDSLRNIVRDPKVAPLALSCGLLFLSRCGRRHDVVPQRPRASLGRSGFAGVVPGRRQGAALGHRHDRGRDLFSMRTRHRPIRPVESGQADRSHNPSDPGPDPGRDERGQGRRRGIRPRLAGTRAANDRVKSRRDTRRDREAVSTTEQSCPDLRPSLKLQRANAGQPRRSLLTAEVRLRTKAVGIAGIRASIHLRKKLIRSGWIAGS